MNKNELIAAITQQSGLSKKDAEKFYGTFSDVIMDTLANGDKVQLVGFGTFESKDRQARKGHNPLTHEPIEIAACKAPTFKPGKAFKDALNAK